MKATLIFPNVTAYDVERFDVRLGEKFRIDLPPDAVGTARWFADADPVLHIEVKDGGASAFLEATKVGESDIQIQVDGTTVLTLHCKVYGTEAQGFNVPAPTVEANA